MTALLFTVLILLLLFFVLRAAFSRKAVPYDWSVRRSEHEESHVYSYDRRGTWKHVRGDCSRCITSKHDDPENSYTTAHRALESFLDIMSEMDPWGEQVRDRGGLDWEEAARLTSRLTEGFKTALCSINGDAVKAIHDFTQSHIGLKDYDPLLTLIEQSKEAAEKAIEEDEDDGGDLDDFPF
jgi:hypothetical protein